MAKHKHAWIVYLLIILALLVFLRVIVSSFKIDDNRNVSLPSFNQNPIEHRNLSFVDEPNYTKVEFFLPAVTEEGEGVLTKLDVEAKKGTGNTLVSIDNLLFFADTQQSIRIARLVAQDTSGIDLKNYDIIYSIDANASLIGGPSAGAALTLATIAAISGKKPRENVIITGTINRDGSIGPVSGILEKANASRRNGAEILLVPLLASRDVIYETSENCETFGQSKICTTETKPKKIDVANETGMKIIEVENITEAMGYFF
jgi:uncharacterized protein